MKLRETLQQLPSDLKVIEVIMHPISALVTGAKCIIVTPREVLNGRSSILCMALSLVLVDYEPSGVARNAWVQKRFHRGSSLLHSN